MLLALQKELQRIYNASVGGKQGAHLLQRPCRLENLSGKHDGRN